MTAGNNRQLRVHDLMHRNDVSLEIPEGHANSGDTLVSGELWQTELRPGLSLHSGNVIESRKFTINSSQAEGLSCIFFLQGDIDARIGDRNLAFRGGAPGSMQGTAVIKTRPESFQRSTPRRQHLRHLVITASPEWLDLEGITGSGPERRVANLMQQHLHCHQWTPSPRTASLVQQLLSPSGYTPELHRFMLEARAIELVTDTLSTLLQAGFDTEPARTLTRHDRIHLQRARELILGKLDQPLSVELIARQAGMSASSLQRLFRRTEGMSVFEYIRRERLQQAQAILKTGTVNVQEASAMAGYSNAANFATAFKKQFGYSPHLAIR